MRERFARWSSNELGAGERSVRVDDPGRLVLYSNRVGGFRAVCGRCGSSVASAFRPLSITPCSACEAELSYDEVICEPATALASAALVLVNVEQAVFDDPEGWLVVLARV